MPSAANALSGSFFFFFSQMTLNLPSNKNKYVCLFPGPLTALSWPHDLGGIDGPSH